MARRDITPQPANEELVELWGNPYKLMPLTRPRQRRFAELEDALDQVDEGKTAVEDADAVDRAVPLLADMIDVLLEPDGDEVPDASEIITARWTNGESTLTEIQSLVQGLGGEVDRPT